MKIGIIREEKLPVDKRVPFSPEQCGYIKEYFKKELVVQPSFHRCFTNEEYLAAGIRLSEDISDCDVLFGVKEVPKDLLIPNKKYFFFSHTIKKQPHNEKLMKVLIEKKIQMVDYECLTDENNNRIIGFGHYAGIVGAYNGIRAYGLRYGLFYIKPAHDCYDKNELRDELRKVRLPNIKIIVTGNGRVANGAIELLGLLGIRRITPFEFTHYSFREATYCQLHSNNYNEPIDGSPWSTERFYKYPEQFRSTFLKYTRYCDLLMHCSFWNPKAPILFSKKDMQSSEFRINVISDISCDINGAVPSTLKASTIDEPFYGYNPITEEIEDAFSNRAITMMAVDNLPCELPRDASMDFGKELIEKVLPNLFVKDETKLIERASICKDGELTPAYDYLADYAGLIKS